MITGTLLCIKVDKSIEGESYLIYHTAYTPKHDVCFTKPKSIMLD